MKLATSNYMQKHINTFIRTILLFLITLFTYQLYAEKSSKPVKSTINVPVLKPDNLVIPASTVDRYVHLNAEE